MTHASADNPNAPTADEIRVGVGQLLQHLQRVGVAYLPVSDADAVAQWAAAFAPPVATEPVASTAATSGSLAEEASAAAVAPSAVVPQEPVRPPSDAAPPPSAPAPPPVAPIRPPEIRQPAAKPAPSSDQGPTVYTTVPQPIADRQASLEHWRQQVAQCTRCHELACTRKQTVFGAGNGQARVVFFGEAPGADEDREGVPFVGRAGQLLTKIIEATKLSRDEVYIMNTLKCRPPGNRNPLPDELANCRPFFETQLEIIQPEYIVCLGLFAAQSLLQSAPSIGRMRGRFHNYHGSKVVVTYHPSYLLRNAKMKGAVWQDMQMMMRDMGTLAP
ncbi:Uracil DNA glycosylase superfamily protein [Rosistilla carotiformis]|uniref:Type-4 uracil-DNA glycosylase n=1 Tax=Rosistilla carotiformis TaxID=2528017 RepID=A0A518JZC0_9BACT|nr:uracil-DNA glycosylase [Rosistilla carotiformis]QDV70893.1 Uracil DNA glycosylase superfamily protein [Rosistilla carotiformis]